MILLFTPLIQLDPTPFTQWGVLGILAFVIVVMGGLIWKLFVKQGERDQVLMNFVDKHRLETTVAMQGVANTVASSHDKLATAVTTSHSELKVTIDHHTRMLDEILMANRVLEQIERLLERLKSKGIDLTREEVENIVRTIIHERVRG